MSVFKKFGISIGILFAVVCLFVNVWYFWVLNFGDKVNIDRTLNIGDQTIVRDDGTIENQPPVEVSYWANKDNSGREILEIKINNIFDENENAYYYHAIQYDLTNGGFVGKGDCISEKLTSPISKTFEYIRYVGFNGIVREYQSSDDWTTSIGATYSLYKGNSFKFKIDDTLIKLGFKNNVYSESKIEQDFLFKTTYNLYNNYDINYFAVKIYDSLQGVSANGENYKVRFDGNSFDIYIYDGNGRYLQKNESFGSLISIDNTINFVIPITTYETGLNSSLDSSIGWCNGSQSYNITSDKEDYFVGRDIISLTEKDFNYEIAGDTCYLTLSQSFIDFYDKYKGKIYLSILIDKDYFTNLGYDYAIDYDTLSKFVIKESKYKYLSDGSVIIEDDISFTNVYKMMEV